jgi:hypothetical protein
MEGCPPHTFRTIRDNFAFHALNSLTLTVEMGYVMGARGLIFISYVPGQPDYKD